MVDQSIPSGTTNLSGSGQISSTSRQTVGGVTSIIDDNSDSQALSTVKQSDSGTLASASAEGRHGQGTAKSQVSGLYTGTGSFSAQAGTSDSNKSAQTQVSGGKEGAKSSAQSSGGIGKSQTQVQLDSNSGATSTNAQSSGLNHGTNSQVQASGKGGMADAQANGEGQTSSQAQIGFQPYVGSNDKEKLKKLENPFRGGGSASAQSGTFRGQSQSQLQGSFHYGISYTGAAQAGSGSGSAALRKPFNFTNSYEPFKFDKTETTTTTTSTTTEEIEHLQGSSSRKTVIAITPKKRKKTESSIDKKEDDYEEYEDDDDVTDDKKKTTKQRMHVITDGDYDVSVKHEELDEKINSRSNVPVNSRDKTTTTTSVTGKKTQVLSNRSQNHNATGKPISSTETRSLINRSERIGGIYMTKSIKNPNSQEETTSKTSYVSVSNSVTGKLNDDNSSTNKKYEHRYYAKSSTCGYFTFSCNVVYGSNGRRKICKPKMPTNPDGTPKC